ESASGRYFMGNTRYSYGKESGEYTTVTCHPELNEEERMQMMEGRFINKVDIQQKRKVVVIGKDIYDALFKDIPALGKYVNLNKVPFKVLMVCVAPASTRHRNAYMPVSSAQTVFNVLNRLHNFAIVISCNTLVE